MSYRRGTSGYFGHSAFPIIDASRWLRYRLMLRLYRNKITWHEGRPYLTEPLTIRNRAIVFTLHLVVLGGLATAIIASFLGIVALIYG